MCTCMPPKAGIQYDCCCLVLPAVDRAFDSSKVTVSSLNQANSRRVMQYHAIIPARPAEQLQSGTKATLLLGHSVKVDAGTRYVGCSSKPLTSSKATHYKDRG